MQVRFVRLLISAAILAATAWAADITGTWKGEIEGPNGNISLTYTFKQDGAKLTGSVTGPQGDPIQIEDGKVEGGKIHFVINVPMNGGMKFANDGDIKSDDEISLVSKNDQGESFGPAITLKKQK
jgi:hypothetical protein